MNKFNIVISILALFVCIINMHASFVDSKNKINDKLHSFLGWFCAFCLLFIKFISELQNG